MDKEKVLSLISDEHDLIMANPFPDEGTRKIKVDFERDFLLLEDENLDCDIYQGHLFNAIKIGLIACQKLENAHDLNLIKELNPKTKKNVHLERWYSAHFNPDNPVFMKPRIYCIVFNFKG